MDIEKIEKVVVDGGTINIPITIDQKVVEDFLKEVTTESRNQKEQNDVIIAQLTEIVNLLRKKRR